MKKTIKLFFHFGFLKDLGSLLCLAFLLYPQFLLYLDFLTLMDLASFPDLAFLQVLASLPVLAFLLALASLLVQTFLQGLAFIPDPVLLVGLDILLDLPDLTLGLLDPASSQDQDLGSQTFVFSNTFRYVVIPINLPLVHKVLGLYDRNNPRDLERKCMQRWKIGCPQ